MNKIKPAFFLLCFFTGSAFFLPRYLVKAFGESHFISSYMYLYLSGIPFFVLGLWLLIHSKAINLKIPGEKTWLSFFVLSFVWYLIFHGGWILLAVLWKTS